jgi:hypothetical protein
MSVTVQSGCNILSWYICALGLNIILPSTGQHAVPHPPPAAPPAAPVGPGGRGDLQLPRDGGGLLRKRHQRHPRHIVLGGLRLVLYHLEVKLIVNIRRHLQLDARLQVLESENGRPYLHH